jgi:hypothetical protein
VDNFYSLFLWQLHNLIKDLFVECLLVELSFTAVNEIDLQFRSLQIHFAK